MLCAIGASFVFQVLTRPMVGYNWVVSGMFVGVFGLSFGPKQPLLRVLLHFADNTYNLGVFVSVWQTAILLSVGLSEKRES